MVVLIRRATMLESKWRRKKASVRLLHWNARIAKNAITRRKRTDETIQPGWNWKNIALAAENTPCIERLNEHAELAIFAKNDEQLRNAHRPVAQFGRAPLSKSGGCGFKSCLACLDFFNAVCHGRRFTPRQGVTGVTKKEKEIVNYSKNPTLLAWNRRWASQGHLANAPRSLETDQTRHDCYGHFGDNSGCVGFLVFKIDLLPGYPLIDF